MVENAPFHNTDIHIAHTLRDTITLAEMAGLGVCIDLFGCWCEADLKGLVEQALANCDLVQVADYVLATGPRRPAPYPATAIFRWNACWTGYCRRVTRVPLTSNCLVPESTKRGNSMRCAALLIGWVKYLFPSARSVVFNVQAWWEPTCWR